MSGSKASALVVRCSKPALESHRRALDHRQQMMGSRHESWRRRIMRIRTRHHERGGNLVEAAIVMPLLLIMMAIVADLGRAYFASITVIDAAREGARYGVTNQNGTEMCARALAEAEFQPLPMTLTCVSDPGHGPGTTVTVTVRCDLPLIMGSLVGRSTIPISYRAAFRVR